MRIRLTVVFALLALVAVVASALVTLHLGTRRSEAETQRRLQAATEFSLALLNAERDRNRSDVGELASRVLIQQAVRLGDTNYLNRILPGVRQTLHNDVMVIYGQDGTVLASDIMHENDHVSRLSEVNGLVRAALGGTTSAGFIVQSGHHLAIAAAAPITETTADNTRVIGAILASDIIDERTARRLSGITNLTIGLLVEGQSPHSTEPLSEPVLSADQWASLRGRNSLRIRVQAADRPLQSQIRPLIGPDDRLVGALLIGRSAASLAPLEPSDLPLYVMLIIGLLLALWGLGAIAAWGLSRPARQPVAIAVPVAALAAAPVVVAETTPLTASLLNGATVEPTAEVVAASSVPTPAPATIEVSRPDELRRLPGLTIDRGRHRVEVNSQVVALTPTEFELLWVLALSPGRVVTRDALLEHLRGEDWQAEPGLLDTHVSNLRRKIEPNHGRPRYILTVRGVGYRLADPDEDTPSLPLSITRQPEPTGD